MWKSALKITTLLLLILCSGCSFNSVFFPVDNRDDNNIDTSTELITLSTDDNLSIQHFMFKPQQTPKATVFVLHGSGSKVRNWHKVIKPLIADNFQVFMMDYRGFGLSQGKAEHMHVAHDAQRALQYLINRSDVKGKPLLLLGQSYGGQIAVKLAHNNPESVDALIIEGTFTSFSDEAAYSAPWFVRPLVRLIVKDSYQSKLLIADIQVPLLVIHSVEDKVVPFNMGETLYQQANSKKDFWQVTGKHVATLINQPKEHLVRVNQLLQSTQH